MPGTFQGSIDVIISSVSWKHALEYLYDVVIFAKAPAEHIAHVPSVSRLLHQAGVTLKLKK